MNIYTQCRLKKYNRFQIAWIPTKFAIMNHILKIKLADKWDNGWKVIEIFGTRLNKYIEAHERDYHKQRMASDIDKHTHLISLK